jgi:hypothetical protein
VVIREIEDFLGVTTRKKIHLNERFLGPHLSGVLFQTSSRAKLVRLMLNVEHSRAWGSENFQFQCISDVPERKSSVQSLKSGPIFFGAKASFLSSAKLVLLIVASGLPPRDDLTEAETKKYQLKTGR